MKKDKLFELLNLTDNQDIEREELLIREEDRKEQAALGPLSDTALVLDKWDLEKGKELVANSPNRFPTPEAMADFYAAAYLSNPILVGNCISPKRLEFLTQLFDTPEYQSTHSQTMLSDVASQIAAKEYAIAYFQLGPEDRMTNDDEAKTLRSVMQANRKVKGEVDDLNDTVLALGCGIGKEKGSENRIQSESIGHTFRRVKGNYRLKAIIEAAGKFRMVAQSKQRQKVSHGYDDMIGVEQDGDIGRLLPLELAQLADPLFELDAMRRLVERQSMCRKYKGVQKVGKGPIVVCVDESGSMNGSKLTNAKAFALAMAWVARHQHRWCALVAFSDGDNGRVCVLPPNKWDENQLMDWLTHFYAGGTDPDVPCKTVPFVYWPDFLKQGASRGKTDMIIITDGQLYIQNQMETNFKAWKQQEKVRVISLIIQGGQSDITKISDEVYHTNGIDVTDTGVEKCLSI